MSTNEKQYYNYIAYYRGIPVYVGKGKDNRWMHTINGQSQSELVNEFYFRNKFFNDSPLDTKIVAYFETEEEALENETNLICEYLPYCNKCYGRVHSINKQLVDKISWVCDILFYGDPEEIVSKFDFRFLFTPKGLLCPYVEISENSPFEKVDDYHIKIKESLYEYFPEYKEQYSNDKIEEIVSEVYDFKSQDVVDVENRVKVFIDEQVYEVLRGRGYDKCEIGNWFNMSIYHNSYCTPYMHSRYKEIGTEDFMSLDLKKWTKDKIVQRPKEDSAMFIERQTIKGRKGGLKGGKARSAQYNDKRIKALQLKETGLTNTEICKRLEVNRNTVARWLKENLNELYLLCKI